MPRSSKASEFSSNQGNSDLEHDVSEPQRLLEDDPLALVKWFETRCELESWDGKELYARGLPYVTALFDKDAVSAAFRLLLLVASRLTESDTAEVETVTALFREKLGDSEVVDKLDGSDGAFGHTELEPDARDASVMLTHYDHLNLPEDASPERIRAQYFALLATATVEEAEALREAFNVLSDLAQGTSYDEQIASFRAQQNRCSSSASGKDGAAEASDHSAQQASGTEHSSTTTPIQEYLPEEYALFETLLQALVEGPEQAKFYSGAVNAIANIRRAQGKPRCPTGRLRFVDFRKNASALTDYPNFLFHVLQYAALLAHVVDDPEQACVDSAVVKALRNRWTECGAHLRELEQSSEVDDNSPLLNRLRCCFEDSTTVGARLDNEAFRTSLSAVDLALLALARPALATAIGNHQDFVDRLFSAFQSKPFVQDVIVYVIQRDPSLMTQYVPSLSTTLKLNAVTSAYEKQGLKKAGVEYLLCTLERLPQHQGEYTLDFTGPAFVTVKATSGRSAAKPFSIDDKTLSKLEEWIQDVCTGEEWVLAYCRMAWLLYQHALSEVVGESYRTLEAKDCIPCLKLLTALLPNREGLAIPAVWYLDRYPALKAKLAKVFLLLERALYTEKTNRWFRGAASGREMACQLFVMYPAVTVEEEPAVTANEYYDSDRLKQYEKHPRQVEKVLIERISWTRDLQLTRDACDSETFLGKVMLSRMRSFAKAVPIEDVLVHTLCQTNDVQLLQEVCDPQTTLGKILHSRTKRSGENIVIENVLLRYLRQADEAQVETVLRELFREGSHLERFMAPRKASFDERLRAEAFMAWITLHSMDVTEPWQQEQKYPLNRDLLLSQLPGHELLLSPTGCEAITSLQALFSDHTCVEWLRQTNKTVLPNRLRDAIHLRCPLSLVMLAKTLKAIGDEENANRLFEFIFATPPKRRLVQDGRQVDTIQIFPQWWEDRKAVFRAALYEGRELIPSTGRQWNDRVTPCCRNLSPKAWSALGSARFDSGIWDFMDSQLIGKLRCDYPLSPSSLSRGFTFAEAWIMNPESRIGLLQSRASEVLKRQMLSPDLTLCAWLLALSPRVYAAEHAIRQYYSNTFKGRKPLITSELARVIINRGDKDLYDTLLSSKLVADLKIAKDLEAQVTQAKVIWRPKPTAAVDDHTSAQKQEASQAKQRRRRRSSSASSDAEDTKAAVVAMHSLAVVTTGASTRTTTTTTTTTTKSKGVKSQFST